VFEGVFVKVVVLNLAVNLGREMERHL
jgi:hypothetical protein